MAITCIPNQPVNFCTPDVVQCDCFTGDYAQKVEQTDTTRFQVDLTQATGTNLLSTDESTFNTACGVDWTCGAKWAIAANVATYTPPGSSTLSLDLGATLATGKYYRIEFDLTTGAGAGATMALQIGGLVVFSFNFDSNLATFTHRANFYLRSKTDDLISFAPTAGDIQIENVVLTVMSFPDLLVKDASGSTVYNFTDDVASHASSQATNGAFTGDELTEVIGGVAVDIDLYDDPDADLTKAICEVNWNRLSLSDGCYTIVLDDTETTDELTSNEFNLQSSHDCTLPLKWDNDSNHFGLVYSPQIGGAGDFELYLRIEAKLYHPTDTQEGDLFTDDGGTATLTYARQLVIYDLLTEPLPEYLHDALSNGIIHDNFYIDGVEYVKRPGDYRPDWQIDYDLASVRIPVTKQTASDVTNRSCKE